MPLPHAPIRGRNQAKTQNPSDWKAVDLAFKDATPLAMQQSWQKDLDATFKPSSIRTGWHGDSLWILAKMQDVSILNPTTRLNEIHDFPSDLKPGQWFVLAEIPSRILEEAGGISPGDVWRFSFCRYDFTQGSEIPILSSTSHHAMRGFHRQQEWGRLKFSR